MECKNCCYYWQDEDDRFCCCHFEHNTPWDVAPCEETEKRKQPEEMTGNELEDAPITNMFMKMSAFFTAAQVEKMEVKA